MKNKGLVIRYNDVAPGARAAFSVESSENMSIGNLVNIKLEGIAFPPYGNPCEGYSVLLDGSSAPIPADPVGVGLWSEQICDQNGQFAEPIVLTMTANRRFVSQGLSFDFDTAHGFHPVSFSVSWYNGDSLITSKSFGPKQSSFFAQNFVDGYDKVVVTFRNWNMPNSRLKLQSVLFGRVIDFVGTDLRTAKAIQEIDPISNEVAINTLDFSVTNKDDAPFVFQEMQSFECYYNGNIVSKTFVKSAVRKSKTDWTVDSEDYIGAMDVTPFNGGIYSGKNVGELLREIFQACGVPYVADGITASMEVDGYIPICTCRDALRQVAFATQSIVDTSNSVSVKVIQPQQQSVVRIPLDKIYRQSIKDEKPVTEVEVLAHSYEKGTDDAKGVFKAENSGAGENIYVQFSEPLHTLTIVDGEILSSGDNFAIINAGSSCVLDGKKYTHTTVAYAKKRTDLSGNIVQNKISFGDATLVSNKNANMVLEKCFDWLTRSSVVDCKIAERGGVAVNPGSNVSVETEYSGEKTGIVTKQSFSLSGGLLAKDVTLR